MQFEPTQSGPNRKWVGFEITEIGFGPWLGFVFHQRDVKSGWTWAWTVPSDNSAQPELGLHVSSFFFFFLLCSMSPTYTGQSEFSLSNIKLGKEALG